VNYSGGVMLFPQTHNFLMNSSNMNVMQTKAASDPVHSCIFSSTQKSISLFLGNSVSIFSFFVGFMVLPSSLIILPFTFMLAMKQRVSNCQPKMRRRHAMSPTSVEAMRL
jgi:hypothetical protein